MTWSISAQGHHNTNDWKQEELDLLRKLVEAFESDPSVHTSSFSFSGNHISASSLADAKEKLAKAT